MKFPWVQNGRVPKNEALPSPSQCLHLPAFLVFHQLFSGLSLHPSRLPPCPTPLSAWVGFLLLPQHFTAKLGKTATHKKIINNMSQEIRTTGVVQILCFRSLEELGHAGFGWMESGKEAFWVKGKVVNILPRAGSSLKVLRR